VPTRELAPTVEAKTTEAQKASEHETNQETVAQKGISAAQLVSQPSGAPLPRIQPGRLNHTDRCETSRSRHYVLQLQRRYGNRFVQRVFNERRQRDADEVAISGVEGEMNGLAGGAQSSDDLVKSDSQSACGAARAYRGVALPAHRSSNEKSQKDGTGEVSYALIDLQKKPVLQAHELTPSVQRGVSALHTQKQTVKTESRNSKTDAAIQRAWYNFSIPFTDYEFDPSIEGIKTAAGVAKDAVVDSAAWVKDKVVAGFEWVFEKIKDLIGAGIDWLKGKYAEIKEFADSSFDSVRTGLSNLLAHITSPVSLITSAFNTMNADLLATAWNALRSGASLVWNGIKSVIDGVFKVGTGLWESASAFVTARFDDVESILDSWPFRQLPEVVQRKARELFGDIRSLWEEIRAFISDTLKRLRAFTDGIIKSVDSFVKKVISYAIQKVIDTVRAIKQAWEFVKKIADDPEGFVRPIIDQLVAKLNSEAPPKAIELGQEKLRENFKGGESSAAGGGIIQRQASTAKPKRSTASSEEADRGIIEAIKKAWASLDLGKMLWESFVNMFWPPATIRAIGHEFSDLWSKDWASAAANFFTPRNILDDPAGFFHDVWSNVLILLDFPLALWRRLNNVFMLLLGYLTIILVIVGAVGGGIAGAAAGGVGAIPGALAGAWAGLELAGAIGLGLLASYFAAESISVIKLIVELRTARQTEEEKNRDYEQIAASLIGMAAAAVLVAILWLLSEFVAAIVRTVKAGRAGGAGVKPPAEEIKPVTEGKPAAEPKPPSKEVKPPQTEEVKPPAEPEPRPQAGLEEGVAAERTTADGHKIKVLEDGRIIICTTCEELRFKYGEEIKGSEDFQKKLADAEGTAEAQAKADKVEALQKELSEARKQKMAGEDLATKLSKLEEVTKQAKEALGKLKETMGQNARTLQETNGALKGEVEAGIRELEPSLKEAEGNATTAKELNDPASIDEVREALDDVRAKAQELEERINNEVNPPEGAVVPRPHLKYPKNMLPNSGDHPYVSPGPEEVVQAPGEKPGYLDSEGNVWQVDRTKARTGRFFEWDVQTPDGGHINVGSDGTVTH
jgi:hypothetical protein